MIADRIQPTAQNASSQITTRPRIRRGANSEIKVEATGSSAPSPSPTTKRNSSRAATEDTTAVAPVASP